jgi:WYL domain
MDHRAVNRRWRSHRVEPYSLRHTIDGHLVLFVVTDEGALRSYRVDRIAGVRPTTANFTPRFRVEF